MTTDSSERQLNAVHKQRRKAGRPTLGDVACEVRWDTKATHAENETLQRLADRYCGGNRSKALRRAVAIYDQFDRMMSDDQFQEFSQLLDLYEDTQKQHPTEQRDTSDDDNNDQQ